MSDISFENILYDNSLEKPKFSTNIGGEKERYPGYSSLLQALKDENKDLSCIGNTIIVGKNSYIIRYNGNGEWAFGGVPDQENQSIKKVFAISKQSEGCYEMVIVDHPESIEIKSRSWSISNDNRNGAKPKDSGGINKEIIDAIKQSIPTESNA